VKDEFEIIECDWEHRAEALELLTRLWSTDIDVNRRYWAWKYDRNPAAGGQRVYLARKDGRVVGTRGFIGALWEWDAGGPGATAWAPCAGDTVVARDCESRGVFRAIMDVAQKDLYLAGHRFMFNLSAGATVFLRSLRGGWQRVGSYDPWERAASPFANSSAAGDPFVGRDGDTEALATSVGSGITVSDQPRAEDMAALVRCVPSSGRIRRVRNAGYYAWRFDNPLSRYRFLYHGDGDLDGFVVVRTGRYKLTDRVTIIDAEAVSPTILNELLDATVRAFGAWNLSIWAVSLEPAIRAHLQSAGFMLKQPKDPQARHSRALLVKATDPSLPPDQWVLGSRRVLDPANWDLRQLWSDGA
jgi:hypothetical protein